ncbi:MFS transporter [Halobellus sp. GM3]|uniref:MFS transporter n=1 Tax=Halobellus sp. GM3 TaxID=3458410 RepID=UPI00403D8082
MARSSDATGVSYRTLLTDSALLVVFLSSGVAALGFNAAPVALPDIGREFALTESEIGLVMSMFFFTQTLSVPLVGIGADLYGRRTILIPSLLLFGVSGIAMLWVMSYPALLGLRAVQGAAFAGVLPLSATLAGDLYTGAEGSTAQGIRSGINGLASAIAPIVAGVLVIVTWQLPFVLFALALPVALLVYWYYPEPLRDDAGRGDGTIVAALGAYVRTIAAAADRRLAIFIAGGFTLFFLKASFTTFLPVFVVSELGSVATVAGTVLGVYGGIRVLVSPVSGSVLLRLGRRNTILLGVALAAVGTAILPFSPDVWTLVVATVFYALGEAVLNPVINDAVAAFADEDQRAGIMSGLQFFKSGALTLAPLTMGFLIGVVSFEGAFVAAALAAIVYGAIVAVKFTSEPDGDG